MFTKLKKVLLNPVIPSKTAQQVFELHKDWLAQSWGTYSSSAHLGLAQMYIADERFTKYYDDRVAIGATVMLEKIIHYYATV